MNETLATLSQQFTEESMKTCVAYLFFASLGMAHGQTGDDTQKAAAKQAEAKINNAVIEMLDSDIPPDLQKAADQGDAEAQEKLGEIYDAGRTNVPQDHAKAMAWYKKVR